MTEPMTAEEAREAAQHVEDGYPALAMRSKAKASATLRDYADRVDRQTPDVSGLVEALERVAEQKLPEEMDAETLSFAAFDDGYSHIVLLARNTLSTFKGGE